MMPPTSPILSDVESAGTLVVLITTPMPMNLFRPRAAVSFKEFRRSTQTLRHGVRRLSLWAGLVLASLPGFVHASSFKHITIDGKFEDWAGVEVAYHDAQERPNATDIKEIWIAHDASYIYVRFSLYTAADPFTARNNFFFNADGDAGSGYGSGRGSEMLIQGGAGYEERNRGFNEGPIGGLDWSASPTGIGTDFEFRVSRSATYGSDQSPVFTSDVISLYLEAETPTFARVEDAPDTGGIEYVLTAPPASFPPGAKTLLATDLALWSYHDAGTDLGNGWMDPAFEPTAERGWSTGQGLFGYAANPAIYPFPLKTLTAQGPTTHYFRTGFLWDYDPVGVVLQANLSLSDGAVIYLNGVEVRRLRVAARPVTYQSPASGGPASPGLVEVVTLPPSTLVVGNNVLAVEVHQTSGDTTDLVFGLGLTASDNTPVLIGNPNEPADREVVEGESTTFRVEASGTEPITYQWFKGTQAIAGATSASYTIPLVLDTDAGLYHVELSNPLTAKLSSRSARLTTRAVAVAIGNPSLPADLELPEGRTAIFSVEATGSAILRYQWLKDGNPIPNATLPTLTIRDLTVADGGEYSVVVSNRLPGSATSRRARLHVSVDRQPPQLGSVVGSHQRITLEFDEALDAVASLRLDNFTFSPGLVLTSVELDPADSSRLLLTTAHQTLGETYTIGFHGVRDLFGNEVVAGSEARFISTIIIDGSFDDWADATALLSDEQDSSESSDWKELYMFNDNEYLYFRVTFHNEPSWPVSFYYNNLFIDSDNSPTTGYHPFGGMGSELLIQGGGGYQEKNGVFNEGAILGLDFRTAPDGVSSSFEFRISRSATYESDGRPVFRHSGVNVALEAENTNYQPKDQAPNAGAVHYTFLPERLDPLAVGLVEGTPIVSWVGEGVLQSRESLTSGTWEDDPDQTNPRPLATDGPSRYYRLVRP